MSFALIHILCQLICLFKVFKNEYIEAWIKFGEMRHLLSIALQLIKFFFDNFKVNLLNFSYLFQLVILIRIYQKINETQLVHKAWQAICIENISSSTMG